MTHLGGLTMITSDGNDELAKTLEEVGFDVSYAPNTDGLIPGIIILDFYSPDVSRSFLSGSQDAIHTLRESGHVVIAAVDPEALRDDRTALTIGAAHAFLAKDSDARIARAVLLTAIHRKSIEDRLRKSEQRYRLVVENTGDVIWTYNLKTNKLDYITPSIERLRGYTVEEALAQPLDGGVMTHESAEKARALLAGYRESLQGGGEVVSTFSDYFDQPCKDGTVKTTEITMTFLKGPDGEPSHVLGVSRDATERMRSKAELEAAVHQREILLRELEHRVKNTLAMIASLLSLAAEQVKDPGDAVLFEESQSRVSALALVYEKLMRSEDAERIDLGVYLEDLCRSVAYSFSRGSAAADVSVEREEVFTNSRKAALIGLAINELTTNSMKYAILPDRNLRLEMDIRSDESGAVRVLYRDNGPGLPAGFDPQDSGGLGFLLIRSLVSQLEGTFTLETAPQGAAFRITVPDAS